MNKLLATAALVLAFAAPASAARPAPIPIPGGPIIVHVDPACVAAGNPVVFCIVH